MRWFSEKNDTNPLVPKVNGRDNVLVNIIM